jgi:hypothetical protein
MLTTSAGRQTESLSMPDPVPARVLISYAHESPEHKADVERLYKLLRANGVDARLDLAGAEEHLDWMHWMSGVIRLRWASRPGPTPTWSWSDAFG